MPRVPEASVWVLALNPGPLQEQQVFLTTESSLDPQLLLSEAKSSSVAQAQQTNGLAAKADNPGFVPGTNVVEPTSGPLTPHTKYM